MRVRSRLLLSTSILAIAFAATPLTIDFDLGEIGPSVASAAKCCFSGDTPVLMADGTVRPIARIRAGDRVMNRSGRANLVIGLEAVPLAGRRLYAINELTPFFTGEHPFLAPGGWKAADPTAAAREVRLLRITPMQTGDLLVAARHGMAESQGATALAPRLILGVERIVTLRSVRPDTDLTVFNLLLDGDHSYVANGFIVHNKGGEDDDGGSGESGSGGENSGESGSGSENSGESGSSGSGGSGESGSGGEAGESGSGGEAGESGSGGEDSGEGGSDGEGSGEGGSRGSDRGDAFSGTADRAGPDLTPEQERALILRRWKK